MPARADRPLPAHVRVVELRDGLRIEVRPTLLGRLVTLAFALALNAVAWTQIPGWLVHATDNQLLQAAALGVAALLSCVMAAVVWESRGCVVIHGDRVERLELPRRRDDSSTRFDAATARAFVVTRRDDRERTPTFELSLRREGDVDAPLALTASSLEELEPIAALATRQLEAWKARRDDGTPMRSAAQLRELARAGAAVEGAVDRVAEDARAIEWATRIAWTLGAFTLFFAPIFGLALASGLDGAEDSVVGRAAVSALQALLRAQVVLAPALLAAILWAARRVERAAIDAGRVVDRVGRADELPRLAPLTCAACGGVLPLPLPARRCPHCRAAVEVPADYEATLGARARAAHDHDAALRAWRAMLRASRRRAIAAGYLASIGWIVAAIAGVRETRSSWREWALELLLAVALGLSAFVITALVHRMRYRVPSEHAAPRAIGEATSFTCAACGAGVAAPAAGLVATCGYCGASVFLAAFARRAHRRAAREEALTSAALGDALYELGERVRVARRGIGTALLALLGVLVFAAFGALGR